MSSEVLAPETSAAEKVFVTPASAPGSEELLEEIQRLKASEREFRKILDWLKDEVSMWRILLGQSREGIVVLDGGGGVVEANLRFAEMLGYSQAEVRKLRIWDWDARFGRSELLEMLRTVDASGAHFETRHRRKDGAVIDVELSNNAATFRDRKLILCICRDIAGGRRAGLTTSAAPRENGGR